VRYPDIPVKLDIHFDQKFAGQTVADRYRRDLEQVEQANLGNGRHGFEFVPEKELFLNAEIVEVRAPNGGVIGTR
jgi:hypothetical protein